MFYRLISISINIIGSEEALKVNSLDYDVDYVTLNFDGNLENTSQNPSSIFTVYNITTIENGATNIGTFFTSAEPITRNLERSLSMGGTGEELSIKSLTRLAEIECSTVNEKSSSSEYNTEITKIHTHNYNQWVEENVIPDTIFDSDTLLNLNEAILNNTEIIIPSFWRVYTPPSNQSEESYYELYGEDKTLITGLNISSDGYFLSFENQEVTSPDTKFNSMEIEGLSVLPTSNRIKIDGEVTMGIYARGMRYLRDGYMQLESLLLKGNESPLVLNMIANFLSIDEDLSSLISGYKEISIEETLNKNKNISKFIIFFPDINTDESIDNKSNNWKQQIDLLDHILVNNSLVYKHQKDIQFTYFDLSNMEDLNYAKVEFSSYSSSSSSLSIFVLSGYLDISVPIRDLYIEIKGFQDETLNINLINTNTNRKVLNGRIPISFNEYQSPIKYPIISNGCYLICHTMVNINNNIENDGSLLTKGNNNNKFYTFYELLYRLNFWRLQLYDNHSQFSFSDNNNNNNEIEFNVSLLNGSEYLADASRKMFIHNIHLIDGLISLSNNNNNNISFGDRSVSFWWNNTIRFSEFPCIRTRTGDKNSSCFEIKNENNIFNIWRNIEFPHHRWENVISLNDISSKCIAGSSCLNVSIVPSAMYGTSGVIYRTWNFESHVKTHDSLCSLDDGEGGKWGSSCTENCLTDIRCVFNITDSYESNEADDVIYYLKRFYQETLGNSFWNSAYFMGDDYTLDPPFGIHRNNCPSDCCGNRRLCYRTHDEIGAHVPFDTSFLLIFGGKHNSGKLVGSIPLYEFCESIISNIEVYEELGYTYEELATCDEIISGELWRLNLDTMVWEYIKPMGISIYTENLGDGSSIQFVDTVPSPRFMHASALRIVEERSDLHGIRRQYLIIFGGISTSCVGICNDLWAYEIAWAPSAYYSTIELLDELSFSRSSNSNSENVLESESFFQKWRKYRPNRWRRLPDCPYGGRYQHRMEIVGDSLLVIGGKKNSDDEKSGSLEFTDEILRFTFTTNKWSKIESMSHTGFYRNVVDHEGEEILYWLSDMSQFTENSEDTLGDEVQKCTKEQNCGAINTNHFPVPRSDHSTALTSDGNSLVMFGGYSGSGFLSDIFLFDIPSGIWKEYYFNKDAPYPHPRRAAVLRRCPNDWLSSLQQQLKMSINNNNKMSMEYFFLLGGHYQDTLFSILWLLIIDTNSRLAQWGALNEGSMNSTEIIIDGIIEYNNKSNSEYDNILDRTYHEFLVDVKGVSLIVFGGLRWSRTNYSFSDEQRINDKRCLRRSRDLINMFCPSIAVELRTTNESDVANDNDHCSYTEAVNHLIELCGNKERTHSSFYCELIDDLNGDDLNGDDLNGDDLNGDDYEWNRMMVTSLYSLCRNKCEKDGFSESNGNSMSPGILLMKIQ